MTIVINLLASFILLFSPLENANRAVRVQCFPKNEWGQTCIRLEAYGPMAYVYARSRPNLSSGYTMYAFVISDGFLYSESWITPGSSWKLFEIVDLSPGTHEIKVSLQVVNQIGGKIDTKPLIFQVRIGETA